MHILIALIAALIVYWGLNFLVWWWVAFIIALIVFFWVANQVPPYRPG